MSHTKITWGPNAPLEARGRHTSAARWQSREGSAWNVQFEYEEMNGHRTPTGLKVTGAGKQSKELTSRVLREIPFGTIFELWLKQSSRSRTTPTIEPSISGPLKGGPLPTEVLEKVAELYRAGLDRGVPPNKFVAQEMGISQSTATKRIVRARKQGLLGPTTPGRQGESK
jgi:hypothetical protein